MRFEDLKTRVDELRNLLLKFAGPQPKRGRRAAALFVGPVPVFAFTRYPYEEAVQFLNAVEDVEPIELLSRLGTPSKASYLLLDHEGVFHTTFDFADNSKHPVFDTAVFEVKITNDGWAFRMSRQSSRKNSEARSLKVKF